MSQNGKGDRNRSLSKNYRFNYEGINWYSRDKPKSDFKPKLEIVEEDDSCKISKKP